MRNPTHTGTTVQQVEKEMMLCLRGSGDREGGGIEVGRQTASHTGGGGGRYRYRLCINQKRMHHSMDELFRCFTLNHSMDELFRCFTLNHSMDELFRCFTLNHSMDELFRCFPLNQSMDELF